MPFLNQNKSYQSVTAVVIVLVLLVVSFYVGRQYQGSTYPKSNDNAAVLKISPALNVTGYYTPPIGDGSTYLLVAQQNEEISITGYTHSTNLPGDENVGAFVATTTISRDGVAKINLSHETNDFPCDLYLLFYHRVMLEDVPPYKDQAAINSVKVFETNSGTACGFGNNVSFDVENLSYEKQDKVPTTLPTSANSLP